MGKEITHQSTEDFRAMLAAKLQGEPVKSVTITDDGFIKFEFVTGNLYAVPTELTFVVPEPL